MATTVDQVRNGGGSVSAARRGLLNVRLKDVFERQLLIGDILGLALLSGSLVWSALGMVA